MTKLKHHYVVMDTTLIDIVLNLHVFFNDIEKVNAWLLTPNLNFGDIAPLRLMQVGRGHKVQAFINDALEGNIP